MFHEEWVGVQGVQLLAFLPDGSRQPRQLHMAKHVWDLLFRSVVGMRKASQEAVRRKARCVEN
jgi:hypothetical protein